MAKITISDLTAAFASTTALNAKFQQLEDELNDKVLYRDSTSTPGEPNSMQQNLDMNGYAIINASVISIDVGGTSIADGVSYASEWAVNAEDTAISTDAVSAAGRVGTHYSSLHWSDKSQDWAIEAEDTPVGVLAGGDGATTFSSLHWAAKAAASASSASNADTAANAIYTTFDDRYLGSKAVAPTTLNDGVTPLDITHDGIEYWNSVASDRYTWDGATLGWILTSGAAATSAAFVSLTDTAGYYVAIEVEAALAELGASTGAAIIGTTDAGAYYTATDVEASLQELGASTGAAIIGLADSGANYAATNVEDAFTELASTTVNEGASIIGINDVGSVITATDVEGALQELASKRVLLDTQTASSSAELLFDTGIDGTYNSYEFVIENVIPFTGTQVLIDFSTDTGSTWIGAIYVTASGGGGTVYPTSSAASALGIVGTIFAYNLPDVLQASVKKDLLYQDTASSISEAAPKIELAGTATAIDAIRFTAATGNLESGVIKLYGVL